MQPEPVTLASVVKIAWTFDMQQYGVLCIFWKELDLITETNIQQPNCSSASGTYTKSELFDSFEIAGSRRKWKLVHFKWWAVVLVEKVYFGTGSWNMLLNVVADARYGVRWLLDTTKKVLRLSLITSSKAKLVFSTVYLVLLFSPAIQNLTCWGQQTQWLLI